MLRYKPRQRVGTKVKDWKNPMDQAKNRGFMTLGKFNVVSDPDYVLTGYSTNEGNANGIRLSRMNVNFTAGAVWWKQTFHYPLTIKWETYISGPADGITMNIMNESGSLSTIGGGGGNQGVPGGNVPPIAYINMDQWNNGQPTPYTGFGDTRLGGGTQYPVYYVGDSVNNAQWREMKILWGDDGWVTVWRNGTQILSGNWETITGHPLPEEPFIVGAFGATGAQEQDAFIRKVTVDDQILYSAPGLG